MIDTSPGTSLTATEAVPSATNGPTSRDAPKGLSSPTWCTEEIGARAAWTRLGADQRRSLRVSPRLFVLFRIYLLLLCLTVVVVSGVPEA